MRCDDARQLVRLLNLERKRQARQLVSEPRQIVDLTRQQDARAVRLVTDTGLHAFGWTREQSIAYMMETEGATEADARNATERYMAFPGQALSYKIGALRIQELRERARAALGERFSLPVFQDLVLSEAIVPLPMLEQMVAAWIARVSATENADPAR